MAKIQIKPNRPVSPTPAALIVSVDSDGKPNIITLGEVFNLGLSSPAIVGIAIRKSRYSHALIRSSGCFTVNLPRADMARAVDACGMVSGKKQDKFAANNLTPLASIHIPAPIIKECAVNMECELCGLIETGDHDLFMGRVLEVHADEEVLDEKGLVSPEKLDTLVFMLNHSHKGEYWSLGEKIGEMGFSSL
jgi:flavin reductase (DIM6/NTAB) family NADH-FMN oxidoreductase RutF